MLRLTPAQRIAGFVRRPSLQIEIDRLFDARQLELRMTEHVRATRLMTHDDHVGLTAVQQSERHAGIRGMKQRALPFDDIPVIRRGGRRKHLCRAGLEVGYDRIHRHARAGDHDPRLTGGAKISVDAALLERPRNRERGVLLAERAIGSDRQQPLATAFATTRDRNVLRRRADVDEAAVITFRRRSERRRVASRACMPLTMSSPATSASSSDGTQLSRIRPPTLATPITMERAPRARASAGVSCGSPTLIALANDSSPTHCSRAQSRRPNAVLA